MSPAREGAPHTSAPRNLLYVGLLPPHRAGSVLSSGGSALSCSQLLVALARAGVSIRALAPITPETEGPDVFAREHPEIAVTRFLVPSFEFVAYAPPPEEYRKIEGEALREKLSALIAEERPDVLMLGRETFAWHVPEVAERHGLPVVMRAAGTITHGILNRRYPDEVAEQWLEKFRSVQLIVTPARFLADGLGELGCADVTIIPNAVDLDQFSRRPPAAAVREKLAIAAADTVVLHASNLKPIKRSLDLVHSAQHALRSNGRLVYVIVGDGALRAAMEQTCEEMAIRERFRFTGWIDYPNVPEYINLADLVVMPSEAEGQSRVYLEAQACGRTLLASDIPAAREVVAHGETGLLFRKGDIDDLTAQTLRAAGDSALREAIGRCARARVMVHSIDRAVAAYVFALDRVLGRAPSSRGH
jgi:glycosyltransferase involved in cell wall biosynthesis